MTPERFLQCWQMGVTLAAVSLAQQEGAHSHDPDQGDPGSTEP